MIHSLVAAAILAAPELAVSIERCESGLSAEAIRRVASLELAGAPSDAALTATIECRGAFAQLTVDDPLTQKTLARRVDLSAVPEPARARTLALALAELVEASWSELLLPGERAAPAESGPVRAVREAARRVVRPPSLPFRVEVLGGGRRFPAMALWLWGGGARVLWLPEWIGLGAEVRAERADGQLPSSYVSVDTLGGSLFGLLGLPHQWLVLEGGVGLRAGSGRVSQRPFDRTVAGSSVERVWLQPMAFGQLGVRWDRLVLLLGLEGGWVTREVLGAGGVGVAGGSFQVTASWGLRL